MFSRKYRIHAILIISFLAIIIYPQYSNKPDQHKVDAARIAAEEFLQMVDDGQLDNSWQVSADYLQQKVKLPEWIDKLTKIKADYGPLQTRELSDAAIAAPVEELPNREMLLLTYAANFEKQAERKELVTMLLDPQGGWQVVGYFIK